MHTKFLIRISTKERIDTFVNEGLIFCNILEYFAEKENNDGIKGDKFENVTAFEKLAGDTLSIRENEEWRPVMKVNNSKLITHQSKAGNIFCLYCADLNDFEHFQNSVKLKIDEKMFEFGDTVCIISNSPEFLNRLDKRLEEDDLKHFNYQRSLVDYIDLRNFVGTKKFNQKDLEFSWQQEFRIFIENHTGLPMKFNIGNISDIVSIVSINNFLTQPIFRLSRK